MHSRTRTLTAVLASAFVLATPAMAGAANISPDPAGRFVPGEVLVRFEAGVVAAERREARAGADVALEEVLELPRTQLVTTDGSVKAAVARLESEPGVADAQPNYRYRALAAEPNDTHFGQLWGMDPLPGIDVLPAWDRTRGGGALIAVLDTGVDLSHPDLLPNLWSGPGGVRGHDFVDNDPDPNDLQYHGTHVAGTAAAVANNNQGVAGVAPEADIMAVRVLDGDGGGSTSVIANGIAFASQNGADVINLSLGGPSGAGDPALSNAATVAEQRGSMIVAAAGNGGADGVGDDNDAQPQSPCNLPNPNIVCVAAVDNQSELSSYSNFGDGSVDVGAPGGDFDAGELGVLSTKPAWVTKFNENFEGIDDWSPAGTGVAWGTEGSSPNKFASDSPGVLYANNTSNELAADNPATLDGQGCRIRFDYAVDTAGPGDFLTVGVDTGTGLFGADFSGLDEDTFEASIPEVDGEAVTPVLQFTSDAAGQDNGALVDELRLACRGGPGDYDNQIVDDDLFDLSASAGGSYMAISGTSMATPHVSGVAALIRSADPGSSPSQVVQAIRDGVRALPSLSGKTVTGGAVDALRSINASLGITNPVTPPPPPTPTPPLLTPPGKAQVARVSVNKRGVITMVVRGDARTPGFAKLTANIARASAARLMTVAARSFRIGSAGRATVKLKLKKAALRQLRRKRRLRVRARIVLTDAEGLSSTSTGTLRLRLRRR